MYDAVLSYHLNPMTSGVARFNHQLAERLGVPLHGFNPFSERHRYPLVSIKSSEVKELAGLHALFFQSDEGYDLLLHDRPVQMSAPLITSAGAVMYADEIGCPSLVRGNRSRGTINVLSFGFAHKYQTTHFERLKHLLDGTRQDYTVSLSTGIHEGTPWDVTFADNLALMGKVFGDNLRALGFLGDDALAKELHEATVCALFFEPAVRLNNTSIWAALEAGCPVITNLDDDSPKDLIHEVSVFDLKRLTAFPDVAMREPVAYGGKLASKDHGWNAVLKALGVGVAA